jgi:S1-C subfamily serine protease
MSPGEVPLVICRGRPPFQASGAPNDWNNSVQDRTARLLLVVVAVLLGLYVLKPYVDNYFLAATTPRTVVARGELAGTEQSTIKLFEAVSPSVVQVVARRAGGLMLDGDESQTPGMPPGGGQGAASGSGFVWDAAGHVVTNDHVVAGAREVAVRLGSGEVLAADVVGTAPNYDLAVLRIRGGSSLPPPVAVGSSGDLKVGQAVFAIGNPFGLDQSLTTGIISALKRRLPARNGREIANMIQTDAAINPGNSGGPLLDSAGRVIGVNTAIISPSGSNAGIGFAVPIDTVNRIVPPLIKDRRVPTPGIGIVAANEAVAGRAGVEGVVIVSTAPGSGAARAGLTGVDVNRGTLGDVIVAANGRKVRRLSDLVEVIDEAGIGKSVRLTVERDGRAREVPVEVSDVGRAS